jgi:hypothetical protein
MTRRRSARPVLTVLLVRHAAARSCLLFCDPAKVSEIQENLVKSKNCLPIGALLLALGCGTREVPASFPADSPASPSAAVGPHVEVAQALREDPPLPGAPTTGWAGLTADAPPAAAHDHGASGAHDHEARPAQPVAAYSCPMHPEVTSDKPGTCPKCGMKLEPKKP